MAENYLQHAEHYYRIVAAAQQATQQYRDDQPREMRDDDARPGGDRGYPPAMRDRQFDDDQDDEQPRLNGGFGYGPANGAHHPGTEPNRPEHRATGNGAAVPDEQPRIDDVAMAEAGLVPSASEEDGRSRRRRGLRASRTSRSRSRQAATGDDGEPGDAPKSDPTPKDA